MLGVSGLMDGGAAAAALEAHDGASGGSGGSGAIPGGGGGAMDESERSGGGGNRWPRQETLALLKIRSDMDVAFRDASLKGPLWEEVSRKMAEIGYQRSAKKCKEKFENVYKYHRRTKDGRATKPDGKSYRFFDQLEALENTPPNQFTPPPPRPQPPTTTTTAAPPPPPPPQPNTSNLPMPSSHVITSTTVSSICPTPLSILHPPKTTTTDQIIYSSPFQPNITPIPPQTQNPNYLSDSTPSSSSSTSSDEDIQQQRGKKRKWKDYFERLMKEVIHKQEELQKKFLEALEKRETDRTAREESWRVQEMARLNREHDLLVQERSIAAAKDAAVIAFLNKATDLPNLQIPIGNLQVAPPPQNPPKPPPPPQTPQQTPPPPEKQSDLALITVPAPEKQSDLALITVPPQTDLASSSRWPKAEVQALINLRTSLDLKYQENGPKGPLWEEISSAMAKLGYKRNAKRCKEKWENINKYFKKVKESNKRRPEDSKTCPYFHQLEAIYKERSANNNNNIPNFKPENQIGPIMARPEQQWPVQDAVMRQSDHEVHEEDDIEEDDDEEEDEGGGGAYEMIANKQAANATE